MPAVEMDNATVRGLLESEVSRLSDYSVGFVLPTATNGLLDASLACSKHVYVDMNLLGKSSRKENE